MLAWQFLPCINDMKSPDTNKADSTIKGLSALKSPEKVQERRFQNDTIKMFCKKLCLQ